MNFKIAPELLALVDACRAEEQDLDRRQRLSLGGVSPAVLRR